MLTVVINAAIIQIVDTRFRFFVFRKKIW